MLLAYYNQVAYVLCYELLLQPPLPYWLRHRSECATPFTSWMETSARCYWSAGNNTSIMTWEVIHQPRILANVLMDLESQLLMSRTRSWVPTSCTTTTSCSMTQLSFSHAEKASNINAYPSTQTLSLSKLHQWCCCSVWSQADLFPMHITWAVRRWLTSPAHLWNSWILCTSLWPFMPGCQREAILFCGTRAHL